ncbi:MAG TPA: uracil-DNA glycosylase [Anaerolineaceae bacterium]|nr:uracil-DNA glycosylase [Anaerolineaceae bacterium]
MAADSFETLQQQIIQCRACPRLVDYREQVGIHKRRAYQTEEYWAKPVPGFGDAEARVLILGLAPGAHGSNRTGRMFTGDASGNFLYPALFRAGFASQPDSQSRADGLTLKDVFVTAVCRCVPPGNKPQPEEIRNCRPFLQSEIQNLPRLQGIVALGKIAYDALLQLVFIQSREKIQLQFGHGVFVEGRPGRPWILASYHPSRQNTQTRRLTNAMFDAIWMRVRTLLVP